jgi:hypothetical protein
MPSCSGSDEDGPALDQCRAMRGSADPTTNPADVTTSPAAASNTKWLPVATTASVTSGPQSSTSAFAHRCGSAVASAMLIANANPTCRLGTAANAL